MIKKSKKTGKFIKTRFDRFCLNCNKPLSGYKSKRCASCAAKHRLKKYPHSLCKHNKKHRKETIKKIRKTKIGVEVITFKNIHKLKSTSNLLPALKKLGFIDKCKKCGKTKNLNIHHKDRNRKNNNINNLEVLCSMCHAHLHKNWKYANKAQTIGLKLY